VGRVKTKDPADVAPAVTMTVFHDVLCVWAYVAQVRIDEAKAEFGPQLEIVPRCCSVFGDTAAKIGVGWADRGGYDGFNRHVRAVADRFEHIDVDPRVWLDTRPASSLGAHLTVKALQHVDHALVDPFTRALRAAFFVECLDIGRWSVQRDVLQLVGADVPAVEATLESGVAHAALASDIAAAEEARIQGSPTFVLNEGRQVLYGNVGYLVLQANIRELLRTPNADNASWC
jgi:predicted DsbA family dithiol-disulfide isomerase